MKFHNCDVGRSGEQRFFYNHGHVAAKDLNRQSLAFHLERMAEGDYEGGDGESELLGALASTPQVLTSVASLFVVQLARRPSAAAVIRKAGWWGYVEHAARCCGLDAPMC